MKKINSKLIIKGISLFLVLILVIPIILSGSSYLPIFDQQDNQPPRSENDKPSADEQKPDTNKPSSLDSPIVGKFTEREINDSETAILAVQDIKEDLGLTNAVDELTVNSVNSVEKVTYYKLQQNYNGIPVYGSNVIVVADQNGG